MPGSSTAWVRCCSAPRPPGSGSGRECARRSGEERRDDRPALRLGRRRRGPRRGVATAAGRSDPRAHPGSGLPWGTIAINLSGSLLLGVLLGLAAGLWVSPEWVQILGVGFLGGYTTFSTASFETVRLLQERRRGAALFNGIGVLVAAAAAAGLGYWLGILLATGG
ncbi:MAG: fluoride efflux transporter FluC [Leucobacter sp.]